MTTGTQETARTAEDTFLTRVYQQSAAHLIARYTGEYDVDAGLARFTARLDEHANDNEDGTAASPAEPDPSVHVHGDVHIHAEPETAAARDAVLGLLIEREQTARRERIRGGQRALAAMIGFAVITTVTLAFAPHFGAPLVVAASILGGLVAAVAIRTQPPQHGLGSGYPDPLLDLVRNTMTGQDTPQSQPKGGDYQKPEPGPGDTDDPDNAGIGTAASVGSRPKSFREIITAPAEASQWELETEQKPLFAQYPDRPAGG